MRGADADPAATSGTATTSEAESDPGTRAPRGSVLKKAGRAGESSARPASVKFNLEHQEEQPPKAGVVDSVTPLPAKPMCIRVVQREYREALQRARAHEELCLKQARRGYQQQLRQARILYEGSANTREQYAERLLAARDVLNQRVAEARADLDRLVREACDLHAQRSADIQSYLRAKSNRILEHAQACRAARVQEELQHPQPEEKTSPKTKPAKLFGKPRAKHLEDVVEAPKQTVQETKPPTATPSLEDAAPPPIPCEDKVVPDEPVGAEPRRSAWTPWTAPLRALRALSRLVSRVAARLRAGARARWRGLTARLRRRVRARTRRRRRTASDRPRREPRRRSSTSSQTVERRVSFAPPGQSKAPQETPSASWAQEWTQRWVEESAAAVTGSAAPSLVDIGTDSAAKDPVFWGFSGPIRGESLSARTSRMRVEDNMRIMGRVGNVHHDPVGSVKSWRRMLYASFVHLKNESTTPRTRRRRRGPGGPGGPRRRDARRVGAAETTKKRVKPTPVRPTMPCATARRPKPVREDFSDKSSALVTKQFVESVIRNVQRRGLSAHLEAPIEATEHGVEGPPSPVSDSTKNSSLEEVLLRKWNIEPAASETSVRVVEVSEVVGVAEQVPRHRATPLEASRSVPVASLTRRVQPGRRLMSETLFLAATRADADSEASLLCSPSIASIPMPHSAAGAHGEVARLPSLLVMQGPTPSIKSKDVITLFNTVGSPPSSGTATTSSIVGT